ncbi:MAG: hypothetical protein ABIR65_02420 [Pseudolysinimonas sp.]
MTTPHPDATKGGDLVDWLLADDADPAIRWQAMRDLTDAAPDAVAAERARMTSEGWASDLLAAQSPDGHWGDNGPGWVTWSGTWRDTMYTAWLLADMGVDPASPPVRAVVERLRDGFDWGEEFGNNPYFAGETEECTNGMVLAAAGPFGEVDRALVERVLSTQLDDGGWNCEAPQSKRASFHGTICVLEGLLAAEAAGVAPSGTAEARRRGEEYLLDRGMFRSLRTGEPLDPSWSLFAYPFSWHYDVLRGLEHLRRAVVAPDERTADAIALVESRRSADGTWPRDAVEGERVRYAMETAGAPSRWNTLRALRVIDWYRG